MMGPKEMLALKWNNHSSTFLGILSELLDKASYCDATVACQGRLYPVHRFVLAACSEYFKDIFAGLGDRHAVIVLKDVTVEVFTDLLLYMYQGEIKIDQEKLTGLISAAEYLKIKGLAEPKDEHFGGNDDIIDFDVVSSSSTGGRRTYSERRGGGDSGVIASDNRDEGYQGDKRKFVKSHEASDSGPYKRKRKDPLPGSTKKNYMSDDSSGTPESLSDAVKGPIKETYVRGPALFTKGALKSDSRPVLASGPDCDVKSINLGECENYITDNPDVKTEPEEIFVLEDTSSNCENNGVDATPFPLSAAEGRGSKGTVMPKCLLTPSATGNDNLQPNRKQVPFGTADVEMRDDVTDSAPDGHDDVNFKICEEEVRLRFSPPYTSDAESLSRNLQQLWQLSMINSHKSLSARQLSPADLGKLSSKDFKPMQRSNGPTCWPPNDQMAPHLNTIPSSSGSTSLVDLNTIPDLLISNSDNPYSTCPSQSAKTSGEQALGADQRLEGDFPDSNNFMTTTSTTRSGKSPDRGRKSQVPYADRAFPCPHCPYRATLKGNLKKHLLKHTGEKPFSCPACDFTTAFHQSLTRHMWSVHRTFQSERDPSALGGSEGGGVGLENTAPGADSSNAWSALACEDQRSNSEDRDMMESQSVESSNYVDASDYLLLEL